MLLPFLLAVAVHAIPAPPAADTVSGLWRVTGDVMGNPINEVCTLKQDGVKLTGICKNTDAADAKPFDVTGEVNAGKITFSHGGEYQGQALTMTYSGTLAATKELKGSVDVQPFGVTGTFSATPASAARPAAPAKP